MAAPEWKKIEELTQLMAVSLLARGVPQSAGACSAATDQAADDWLRRWIATDPALAIPVDPVLLRVLLARFRYATAFAGQCALARLSPPAAAATTILEVILIDSWHRSFRARWLAGEQGVAPAEN